MTNVSTPDALGGSVDMSGAANGWKAGELLVVVGISVVAALAVYAAFSLAKPPNKGE